MRILQNCPLCSKNLIEISQVQLGNEILRSYKCGHSFADSKLTIPESEIDFFSVDKKFVARDYQKVGVEFILNANYCAIIGDQMRLGKTPQSLLAVKNAFLRGDKKKILIQVRAANTYQWLREVKTWVTNGDPLGVYLISGTKDWIPPGFKIYIISMDTFGRRGTCKSCGHIFHDEECKKKKCGCTKPVSNGDAMSDILLAHEFDLVIIDEAHSFKNTDSNRSQALTAFLKNIERSEFTQKIPFACAMCAHTWSEEVVVKIEMGDATKRVYKNTFCPKCFAKCSSSAVSHVKVERKCGVIPLSGTSIKNNADEYFVPLNLVAPTVFTSKEAFRRDWLIKDDKNRWRINPYRKEQFRELIKPYVLRREKENVYAQLPKLNRIFTVIEVTDERLRKAYNSVIDEIESNVARTNNFSYFANIGELQKLRRICGMAKVPFVADYAETFLSDSEKAKVAIGIHHHSVRDTLAEILSPYGVLKLSGEDSPETKDRIMRNFEHSPEQLLVINMLAGGVGMDFHYCDNALIVERQWNSAEEEQFEFRFYNPDPSIKTRPTNIEYILAKGTTDEFFHEMIEEKREIFGETIGNNWNVTTDQTSFKQLLERTISSRL